jgi:trehalose 6-phosphate phosphatase
MIAQGDTAVGALAAPPQPGLVAEELAFFLDVDGTLLEIAATPESVVVDEELLQLLRGLALRCHGAVAFVSGRSLATLDELFRPLILPAAGLHGFERRRGDGTYRRQLLPPGERLNCARAALQRLVRRHPDLILEDKRFALALHYRAAPHLEAVVLDEVATLAADLTPTFELQRGRSVAELRPATANKASAIAAFMNEAPFSGRRPLCLGDDLTDECAFEWVNRAGGVSLAVGVERHSCATAHLQSVRAARLWLHRLVERPFE